MAQTTTVVTIQQNVREWNSGVLSCCDDVKACLCGLFCMPCLLCRVAGRLNEDLPTCTVLCVPGAALAFRTKLRTLYGIKGSILNDCMCLVCCGPCTVCQMDRELAALGL
eukprot:GHVO01003596.1.p1 GENE.GHVO01003596.1~~GHVO01003596.1.p1  ORF type:complete len:110 (+),score=6.37 GHVO01003596.1:355-684(+)